MKIQIFLLSTLLLFLAACRTSHPLEPSATEQVLQSRNYVFRVQTANPVSGSQIQVAGSGYELRMMNDSLSIFLPFFGRAFDPGAARGGGPIELYTKAFRTDMVRKNERWEVTIQPDAPAQVRQIYLSVSPNGYATLQVFSISRDNMSFNGIIEPLSR